jgi:hypothetical protein
MFLTPIQAIFSTAMAISSLKTIRQKTKKWNDTRWGRTKSGVSEKALKRRKENIHMPAYLVTLKKMVHKTKKQYCNEWDENEWCMTMTVNEKITAVFNTRDSVLVTEMVDEEKNEQTDEFLIIYWIEKKIVEKVKLND